jgi:hypothetical protein
MTLTTYPTEFPDTIMVKKNELQELIDTLQDIPSARLLMEETIVMLATHNFYYYWCDEMAVSKQWYDEVMAILEAKEEDWFAAAF